LEKFANDFASTLADAIDATSPTIRVRSSTGAPGNDFRVRVCASQTATSYEIMIVTAVAGNVWTVTRGAEGTVAAPHGSGELVVHCNTAGVMGRLVQKDDNPGEIKVSLGGTGATQRLEIYAGGINFKRLPAPGAFAVNGVIGGALSPDVTYTYTCTFVNASGETTESPAVSYLATDPFLTARLTGIPTDPSGVATARRIYMYDDLIGDLRLIATINDNTTTTYLDTLGAAGGVIASAPTYNSTAGRFYLDGSALIELNETTLSVGLGVGNNKPGNAGFGVNCLGSVTSGYNNTALGLNLLARLTTGIQNAACGYVCGTFLTTGNFNTLFGSTVGQNITSGSYNLYCGSGVGNGTTTGSNNIFFGQSAGFSNQTGSNNIGIGTSAGPNGIALTKTISIGSGSSPTASNMAIIGGTGSNAVQVGVNIQTPVSQVHFVASAIGMVGAIVQRFSAATTADMQQWRDQAATVLSSVSSTGEIATRVAGVGFRVKEGANARMGVATLVAGTITISNTSITANTRIFRDVQAAGGTQGHLSITRIAGTSFTINSTSATETSTVAWLLMEPA